jgi:hypothetical protein
MTVAGRHSLMEYCRTVRMQTCEEFLGTGTVTRKNFLCALGAYTSLKTDWRVWVVVVVTVVVVVGISWLGHA